MPYKHYGNIDVVSVVSRGQMFLELFLILKTQIHCSNTFAIHFPPTDEIL